MRRSIRTVSLVLGSAAVAAGAALLFAPQSGERTRRQIRLKAASVAKDLREDVNVHAHELYSRGTGHVRRWLRHVRKIGPIAA